MSKSPQEVTSTNTTTVDPVTAGRQTQLWDAARNTMGTTGAVNDPYAKPRSFFTELAKRDGPVGEMARRNLAKMGPAPQGEFQLHAFQPYTGEMVPGVNDDMRASYDMARSAAGAGMDDVGAGGDIFRSLANFNPSAVRAGTIRPTTVDGQAPMVSAGSVGDPTNGGVGTVSARDVMAKQFTDYDLTQYTNPFTGQVIDSAMGDLERARQVAIQQGQSAAAKAGSYGGSRHGVRDGMTNDAFSRTAAATSAGLRRDAYDSATGLITADANRQLAADQGNQNTDVAVGSTNMQGRVAEGSQRLQAGIADAGNQLAASSANAGLWSDLAKFNANARNDAETRNVGNRIAVGQGNQSAEIAGAGVRGNAAAGLLNTGTTRNSIAAKGADLVNRIGVQQRGVQGEQNTAAYQEFMRQQDDPMRRLGFLSGMTGTPGSTSTNTQQVYQNPLGNILGAASTLLPLIPGVGTAAKAGMSYYDDFLEGM